jgi:hypothetical protein
MPVVVEFHRSVRDDLERWAGGSEPDDENRPLLVRTYLEELERVLADASGHPPGAIRVATGNPQVFRWRYTGEAEIVYEVRTTRQSPLYRTSVRIIVTQIRLELVG